MSNLLCQSYTFDPRPNYPFLLTAKRYWRPPSSSSLDPTALTLVFTHGIGFHKEHWEPTIEELYNLEGGRVNIREAWSIDAPNHGDAAILNEKTFEYYQPISRWEDYARGVHAFLAGLGTGVDVDFTTHRLVGIGHSFGAASFILSATYFPHIKYTSVVLVEPVLFVPTLFKYRSNNFEASAMKRRDIWPSREEAYISLKTKSAFQVWDDRVLRIFVEHGLRPLPTIDYPDKLNGVTLRCSKFQEAAIFRDMISPSRIYEFLSYFVKGRPVHIIYGTADDFLVGIKSDILHKASGGAANFASISWVEDAGHLVVQTSPQALAKRIFDTLPQMSSTVVTAAAPRAML